jgi:hypothetical protein
MYIPRRIELKARRSCPANLGRCFSVGFGRLISWLASILGRDLGVGQVSLPTFL